MMLAIHSSGYLFSALQQLLQQSGRRIQITALACQALQDWNQLLQSLAQHPVPITTLVPHAPHYVGASDASGEGMGGFWFPTRLQQDTQPCIWHYPFTADIRTKLVTATNPNGKINNSELEPAAAIFGHSLQLLLTPPTPYVNII